MIHNNQLLFSQPHDDDIFVHIIVFTLTISMMSHIFCPIVHINTTA